MPFAVRVRQRFGLIDQLQIERSHRGLMGHDHGHSRAVFSNQLAKAVATCSTA